MLEKDLDILSNLLHEAFDFIIDIQADHYLNKKNDEKLYTFFDDLKIDVLDVIDKIDTNKNNFSINRSIGDKSSVLDDTPEERDERNYGVNESIEKIRSEFKRYI